VNHRHDVAAALIKASETERNIGLRGMARRHALA
jgi:hypothetical protein